MYEIRVEDENRREFNQLPCKGSLESLIPINLLRFGNPLSSLVSKCIKGCKFKVKLTNTILPVYIY